MNFVYTLPFRSVALLIFLDMFIHLIPIRSLYMYIYIYLITQVLFYTWLFNNIIKCNCTCSIDHYAGLLCYVDFSRSNRLSDCLNLIFMNKISLYPIHVFICYLMCILHICTSVYFTYVIAAGRIIDLASLHFWRTGAKIGLSPPQLHTCRTNLTRHIIRGIS